MAGIISPSFQQAYLYSFFTSRKRWFKSLMQYSRWLMNEWTWENFQTFDMIQLQAELKLIFFLFIIQLFICLYVLSYSYGNTKIFYYKNSLLIVFLFQSVKYIWYIFCSRIKKLTISDISQKTNNHSFPFLDKYNQW